MLPLDTTPPPPASRRRGCPEFGAARPPPSASGTFHRRGPWQPAGHTSPPNRQLNRDGNRFPLARRQGFLHAPPPFSTTPPHGITAHAWGPHICCSSVCIPLFQRSSRHTTEIYVQYSTASLTVWLCRICLRHNVYITNQFQTTFAKGGGVKNR
jgi:hypothetical protein